MTAVVKNNRSGRIEVSSVGNEKVQAYVPYALPPDPPIALDQLYPLIDRATQSLGRLDGISTLLPDTDLFIYFYVRKEALLSSQIEGTQSSLSDLLLFEADEVPGVPMDDVREVSNYVAAMNHGLERLRDGFPLSLRLIREIHEILLKNGRGTEKTPGEFRLSQNWIGGTRPGNAAYVPPPQHQVPGLMGDLEKFIHNDEIGLPLLVKAGLIHVQFESIHPFLDGNGRLGRLLVTFLLCAQEAMKAPLLYLSLYLKTYRNEYYDLLQRVRFNGEWEAWLKFFLQGVSETSEQATEAAQRILLQFETARSKIESIGRPAGSAMRVHEAFQRRPIQTVTNVAKSTGLSPPTASKSIVHLMELGIVDEITGHRRDRIFAYRDYLSILKEGTEPMPR